MSDDLRHLERQLEQATARAAPPDASLDPETASLREAWLALGQLLEAAQAESGPPAQPWSPPRGRTWIRWTAAVAVAVAASLLIGVGIWALRAPGPSSGPQPSPDDIAGTAAPVPEAPTPEPSPSALPAGELAWNDALDNEIVLAGQALLSVQEDPRLLAGSSDPLRYGLQAVAGDLEGNRL